MRLKCENGGLDREHYGCNDAADSEVVIVYFIFTCIEWQMCSRWASLGHVDVIFDSYTHCGRLSYIVMLDTQVGRLPLMVRAAIFVFAQ